MKRILVTGAAGTIGIHIIKYLLSEGKYEITALDLKNKRTLNRLKRYRRRINIIYGDVCNRVLMEALVKDHDIIFHLAGSSLPLADMKAGLADIIDFRGTENIVRAIAYYNEKSHLFYASSTTLYKDVENASVKTPIKLDEYDYYNTAKKKAEDLIREKLKNYTIYRLPLVLSHLSCEPFMYHGRKKDTMDYITKEDAAYAFVKGINYTKELNKKIFNVCAEDSLVYKDLLQKILEIHGVSFRYCFNRMFIEKNFYSPVCKDKDELNNIINYRNDTLVEYYQRLRGRSKKRQIYKWLAKPIVGRKKW